MGYARRWLLVLVMATAIGAVGYSIGFAQALESRQPYQPYGAAQKDPWFNPEVTLGSLISAGVILVGIVASAATLRSEVRHIKDDVVEAKRDVREMKQDVDAANRTAVALAQDMDHQTRELGYVRADVVNLLDMRPDILVAQARVNDLWEEHKERKRRGA